MGRSEPGGCGSDPRARPKPKGGVFAPFLEIIFNAKVFPEKVENTSMARKIPEKFQKFQGNSQR
jgi:hypothetical protein